jgi:hypothetical protein
MPQFTLPPGGDSWSGEVHRLLARGLGGRYRIDLQTEKLFRGAGGCSLVFEPSNMLVVSGNPLFGTAIRFRRRPHGDSTLVKVGGVVPDEESRKKWAPLLATACSLVALMLFEKGVGLALMLAAVSLYFALPRLLAARLTARVAALLRDGEACEEAGLPGALSPRACALEAVDLLR